jgi:hypothetical protein
MPIGPVAAAAAAESPSLSSVAAIAVVVRYMYEGGHISQGRLCHLRLRPPANGGGGAAALIPAAAVMRALRDDGVDLDAFYATAYESMTKGGGWMPLEPAPRHRNLWDDAAATADFGDNGGVDDDDDRGARRTPAVTGPASSSAALAFPIPPREHDDGGSVPLRIDVKLFRRPKSPTYRGSGVGGEGFDDDRSFRGGMPCVEHLFDALGALSASVPCGKVAVDGYFGIGVSYPCRLVMQETGLGVRRRLIAQKFELTPPRVIRSPAFIRRNDDLVRYSISSPAKTSARCGARPTSSGRRCCTPSGGGASRTAPTPSTSRRGYR